MTHKEGIVKLWNVSAGWGFVSYSQGDETIDCYVLAKYIKHKRLIPGKPVKFKIEPLGQNGQAWAVDVEGEGVADEVICRHFRLGNCREGAECKLVHSSPGETDIPPPHHDLSSQLDKSLAGISDMSPKNTKSTPTPAMPPLEDFPESDIVEEAAPPVMQGLNTGMLWQRKKPEEEEKEEKKPIMREETMPSEQQDEGQQEEAPPKKAMYDDFGSGSGGNNKGQHYKGGKKGFKGGYGKGDGKGGHQRRNDDSLRNSYIPGTKGKKGGDSGYGGKHGGKNYYKGGKQNEKIRQWTDSDGTRHFDKPNDAIVKSVDATGRLCFEKKN